MSEFTLKEFETLNYYSNDSLQKIVRSLVNESSNAVLINMFEDSVILLDHEQGRFYMADYKFDPKKLSLMFENFEEIQLRREVGTFKDKVYEYFDSEEATAVDLAEAYKNDVVSQEKFINDLINESMSTKDFSELTDYSKIKEYNESTELSIKSEKFFKQYAERLTTHPLTEVKYFNWKDPVVVSLVETEENPLVNKSAIEKANELWKKEGFKGAFEEAASTFIEDVEEGADKFKTLLETYPQIFFLDKADRKTMFGKTILASNQLRESMDILIKGIDLLFEKFDLAEMKAQYLEEAKEAEEEMEDEGEEEEGGEKKEPKAEKPSAPELDPEELSKIASELKKMADEIDDEKIKEKLLSLVSKLEKGKEEGTRPDVVKECVSILSL